MIDAGAEALRQAQQGGKRLTPWPETPADTKHKWRLYAACVLNAAEEVVKQVPRGDGNG